MWLTQITLKNIRCFEHAELDLSRTMNLIVGANNSGKSTLLRAVLSLTADVPGLDARDARVKTTESFADLEFGEPRRWGPRPPQIKRMRIELAPQERLRCVDPQDAPTADSLPRQRIPAPEHWIHPVLAHRKVAQLASQADYSNGRKVSGDYTYLIAHVKRILADRNSSSYRYFIKHAEEILAIDPTTWSGAGSQESTGIMNSEEGWEIEIQRMGDGVIFVIALLTGLCEAENRLFVIEEPESDLHPLALKQVLGLIAKSCLERSNQFIVTTHSNIVLRTLGAISNAKAFKVSTGSNETRVPTSRVEPVQEEPAARIALLTELGYELQDSWLPDAWLVLEESSAEALINEFLLPTHAPGLIGRLKTVTAGGTSKVEMTAGALKALILYAHLTDAWRGRMWVAIDADPPEQLPREEGWRAGASIIKALQESFKDAPSEQFKQFREWQFENYYPRQLQPKLKTMFQEHERIKSGELFGEEYVTGRDRKRKAKDVLRTRKRELLNECKELLRSDVSAMAEFATQAADVIAFLQQIEHSLKTPAGASKSVADGT